MSTHGSLHARTKQELPKDATEGFIAKDGVLVSVIVVSAGREDCLNVCLESIQKQTHRNLECFVFLNSATPEDVQRWTHKYPVFHFDHSCSNELYCQPQNKGIRKSHGDFVLCLNDDVFLSSTFIEKALSFIETDARLGAVSGCILRETGGIVDSLGLSFSRSRKPLDIRYGQKMSPSDAKSSYVFGVNGAVAFYRRRMLEDIKIEGEYFDEDYGIYYEDFDLAWRSQKAGWKALYCPEAVAIHRRGATTRTQENNKIWFLKNFALTKIPKDLQVRHIRNRYITMIKNENLSSFLKDLPWIIFYELRLLGYLLFFERAVLKSVFSDLRFISLSFAKRRKILELKK